MKIAIGCDHGGYEMKHEIIKSLEQNGHTVSSFGTDDNTAVDYPDVALEVAREVLSGNAQKGILICGTGIGISIAANKVKGIRAALCTDEFMTRYTVMHNDSNVLCLGARVIGTGKAIEMVETFLNTEFEGGRHATRVAKITDIENKEN